MDNGARREQWWVQAQGRSFGPFTIEQMVEFVSQDRIAGHTLVCATGDAVWRQAGDVARLSTALLSRRFPAAVPADAPVAAATVKSEPVARTTVSGDVTGDLNGAGANMLICALIHSPAAARFEGALRDLGMGAQLWSGAWLLRTGATVAQVRKRLAAMLEPQDQLVVIDASHNRIGWLNLGPEAEAHLRAVWNQPVRLRAANE
jgi:hypothetical protein